MLSLISQVVDHFSLNKFKNEQKECLLKKYDMKNLTIYQIAYCELFLKNNYLTTTENIEKKLNKLNSYYYYRDLPSYLQKLIDTLEINHECIYDILDFIDEYKKDQKNKNPIHWENVYNEACSNYILKLYSNTLNNKNYT
jgi:hypothetical protein